MSQMLSFMQQDGLNLKDHVRWKARPLGHQVQQTICFLEAVRYKSIISNLQLEFGPCSLEESLDGRNKNLSPGVKP